MKHFLRCANAFAIRLALAATAVGGESLPTAYAPFVVPRF